MITLRTLTPQDYPVAAQIFFDAVREGTREVYTAEQRHAWAGDRADPALWRDRLAGMEGVVALIGGAPVGFMTIDATGYVDFAFVRPDCARQGIGARLLEAVEARARQLGATEMSAHASLASTPFFARHGWQIVAPEVVERRGVALRRNRMRKPLPGGPQD